VNSHFIPFGNRVLIQNGQQLLTCVLTIARAVWHKALIHSIGIIYNDIRWDNAMESDDDVSFLVDFDDAHCLSNEASSCFPLNHLGADEHYSLLFQEHRGELSNYCQAANGTLNSIDEISID
jgi:hypothetical protein